MNKNYKENLKARTKNKEDLYESRKKLDIKEFKVKRSSELLTYLIEELHFSRNNAKNFLSHRLVSIDGAAVTQFNFLLFP